MVSLRPGSETNARVWAFEGSATRRRSDRLATEEPLEMRLSAAGRTRTLAVTMRTPGADFELVAGFLHAEGVVEDRSAIRRLSYCVDEDLGAEQRFNVVNVELAAGALPDLSSLDRHGITSSACGVCGKATLEALHLAGCRPLDAGPRVDPSMLLSLPDKLRAAQRLFSTTGGLHAAALFDDGGELMVAREDVGRHNAVDKVVGWALLQGRTPLDRAIAVVSGRLSFEIVQKCLVARIPMICAVSAPSSLAVSVAKEFGVTLVGFLRGDRFNVYAGPERIAG